MCCLIKDELIWNIYKIIPLNGKAFHESVVRGILKQNVGPSLAVGLVVYHVGPPLAVGLMG
jgi:hypothetical protein